MVLTKKDTMMSAIPIRTRVPEEERMENEAPGCLTLFHRPMSSRMMPSALNVVPANANPDDFTLMPCARAITPCANSCTRAMMKMQITQYSMGT